MFTPGKRNIVYVTQSPFTPRLAPTLRSQSSAAMVIQRAYRRRRASRVRVSRPLVARPEMKHKIIQFGDPEGNTSAGPCAPYVDCTEIGQGTDLFQRVGASIRIHRIEVTGRPGGNFGFPTFHLVKFFDTSKTPLVSDFSGSYGTVLKNNQGVDLCRPWTREGEGAGGQIIQTGRCVYTNRAGLVVKYPDGSDVACQNRIHAVTVNNIDTDELTNINCTVRVVFSDY